MPDWRTHLLESDDDVSALLERVSTVAVLGVKPAESRAPAYYVPEYAQRAGLRVIPVPVYYPDLHELFGERVHRSIVGIAEPVDLVNVFRRPEDIPAHMDDLLAARPRGVWLQSGIRHDESAERLARAGIDVVQDRCLMVELQARGR